MSEDSLVRKGSPHTRWVIDEVKRGARENFLYGLKEREMSLVIELGETIALFFYRHRHIYIYIYIYIYPFAYKRTSTSRSMSGSFSVQIRCMCLEMIILKSWLSTLDFKFMGERENIQTQFMCKCKRRYSCEILIWLVMTMFMNMSWKRYFLCIRKC